MKRYFILSFVQSFFAFALFAQPSSEPYRGNLIYGIQAGATYSSVKGLQTTILSEPFFLNYTLKPEKKYGLAAGFFVNYRFDNPENLGTQLEVMYAQQGSGLKFNNIEKDFNYNIQFKYKYLNVAALLKIYPWDYDYNQAGLNIDLGFQLGFNLTPENITYTSGGTGRSPAFGTDLEQQQQLRNVLKGRNNTSAVGGLGFEGRNYVINARCFLGLSDVTETMPNSYNFIENMNKNLSFQLTIGFYLP